MKAFTCRLLVVLCTVLVVWSAVQAGGPSPKGSPPKPPKSQCTPKPPSPPPCPTPPPEGLLGVEVVNPLLTFDSGGKMMYDAEARLCLANATVLFFRWDGTQLLLPFGSAKLKLAFRVTGGGQGVEGVDGPDLVVTGTIDIDADMEPEYDGVLLEAEVEAMGFESAGEGLALFDLTFRTTGGALAGVTGQTIGLILTSESSTFQGTFCSDFAGGAKGTLGTTISGDVCPRTPGYWKNHPSQWPVQELTIGGEVYDRDELMNLLSNKTPDGMKAASDATVKLAKFVAATKLSLLAGADPLDIVTVLVDADVFLHAHPIGSQPEGELEIEALILKDQLDFYLNAPCEDPCGDDDGDD